MIAKTVSAGDLMVAVALRLSFVTLKTLFGQPM